MATPQKKPLVYVTRDIERALGMEPAGDYFIIANKTPYSEGIATRFPDNIWLIKGPTAQAGAEILGTRELILDPAMKKNFAENPCDVIVFKNTARVEEAARESKIAILNPKASLAEQVENKMTQVAWLGELAEKYLPPHAIKPASELVWEKDPFILQWAHGHTGGGTILVNTEAELKALQEKFPKRMARTSSYLTGPSFTVNAVVGDKKVLVGNVSYQITGLAPFTEKQFTTVGNDWSATYTILSEAEVETIHTIAREVGAKLLASGWKGLYGIDVMKDDVQNKIFLIEVNARQAASTTFESLLQAENRNQGIAGITLFEAHLKALRGETIDQPLILINDGAQIVQRITSKTKEVSAEKVAALESTGFVVVPYTNTDDNEDLLRIQSILGIMEGHGKFNARGKEIEKILSAR